MLYDVREYGAVGDGLHLNTSAIQSAIDACSKNGGGTVCMPAGTYLSGTIVMKNHVKLEIGPGATLLGSHDPAHYPPQKCERWNYVSKCFVFAAGAHDFSIVGPGIIDGQGSHFARDNRHVLIHFGDCQNVLMENITLLSSPCWFVHPTGCDHLTFRGITIDGKELPQTGDITLDAIQAAEGDDDANAEKTHWWDGWPQTDGFDIDSCQFVTISDCRIKCGDDGIALKTNIRRACRNITVTNCTITTRWAGLRIGPESLGGFENITYSNCVIHDTYGCGIKLQMSEESRLQNVLFSNIMMDNVTGPISIRLSDWGEGFSGSAQAYTIVPRPPDDLARFDRLNQPHPIGFLRNVMIENIRAIVPPMPEGPHYQGERHSSIGICGMPGHPIEGITLSNIHVTFPGGGTAEEATRRDLPEMERELPEYFRFGVFPAYGMYARHAKDLKLNNIRFDLASPDLRPAIVCEDVANLEIAGLAAEGNADVQSLIDLSNVKDVFIQGSRPLSNVKAFVRIEESPADSVLLEGNDLRKAAIAIEDDRD